MSIDLEAIFGDPGPMPMSETTGAETLTIRAVVRSDETFELQCPTPDETPPLGSDGWPANAMEPGDPCPTCAGLAKWWDIQGGEHCQRCEAGRLERGWRLAARASRLRSQGKERDVT